MLQAFKILIYVFFGLAAFFLLLTVMEYFLFRIPEVRAELSGKKARRALKKMSEEKRGNEVPIGRGLTGTLKPTGVLNTSGALNTSGSLNKSGSLDDGMMMTENLPRGKAASAGRPAAAASAEKAAPAGRLKITKEVLVIHTEERIEL